MSIREFFTNLIFKPLPSCVLEMQKSAEELEEIVETLTQRKLKLTNGHTGEPTSPTKDFLATNNK